MKLIHRYLLSVLLKNLGLSLAAFTALFLIIDFFDRIDNILPETSSFLTIAEYFLYKIPVIVSLMLPVSMLVATLFTIGMLSKNSEITAMRAAGMTIGWIARPVYLTGLALSLTAILMNETLVPYATRRAREIYNLDIQKKDEAGTYSQSDFWWRTGNSFFSVRMFDSRTDTLHDLVRLDLTDTFQVVKRTDAARAEFLTESIGWSMKNVTEYRFTKGTIEENKLQGSAPLNISSLPQDFYDVKTDPKTMSYRQLKKYIKAQAANGVSTQSLLADLYEKLSSPCLIFIVPSRASFCLKAGALRKSGTELCRSACDRILLLCRAFA
jgi:lipopolysaccharide export system permease protein